MASIWPFKKKNTDIRPVSYNPPQFMMPQQGDDEEEDGPLSVLGFLWYLFGIAILWLVIKPVVDTVVTDMFPSIQGMTNGWITLWKAMPWLITGWMLWKAVRGLLKS